MNPSRRSLVYAALGLTVGLPSAALASFRRSIATQIEFTVIRDMDASVPDAIGPLVFGPDGNLYGVSEDSGRRHAGLIFRVEPEGGGLTVLYEFDHSPGRFPAGLTLGSDGLLYGVLRWGPEDHSFGFVYRMTLDGEVTMLQGPLPWSPDGPLLEASDGRWYGTAGEEWDGWPHKIYRMPFDCSSVEVVHEFSGLEGNHPGGLIEARNGLIYGSATYGGTQGKGTVFSMTPDGQLTRLYSFEAHGRYPAGLVLGPAGQLLGTTEATKPKNRYRNGTIFSIHRQSGKLKTLFDFPKPLVDGKGPVPLVRGRDGLYYGATTGDGKNSNGTLLRMTPEGVVQTLFQFNRFGDTSQGGAPYVRLTEGANGEFYGLTKRGGANEYGTLFRMQVMA
ncbi:SMP-30/gluconolactonase/LRE family protein [Ideonella sp. YS5]|uniref:SMP-30/gluconolactonase/LRE family protein n=1 Tax=Ideonella sp. YS5 TaxID=3453714 RepID=UPI003EEF50DE